MAHADNDVACRMCGGPIVSDRDGVAECDVCPVTLTLPNGHTVTMVARRNEWATSDTDDDAWRVVLDTSANRLEGDEPGSYTPNNGAHPLD